MGKLFTLLALSLILITTSCEQESPGDKNAIDPAVANIYNDYYSHSLKNPKLKMFFQNPDWNKGKSWNSGDTVLYHFPFATDVLRNQVLLVKSFKGHNQFDIQVENLNARLSSQDAQIQHIYFPVHPEMASGRILAGGHNCGSCHNYAWWDTFNEVTITASAPTNNDPFVPDWWGGNSVYSYVSYIENKITNPCFNNVFNQMRKGRFDNEVQKILSNFNKSSNLAFSIKNAPTMSDGNAQKAAEVLGNQIVLNSTLMANASQEFVTATIYHEVLHIYINNTETFDHNTMSSRYVTPMIQALMSWFPLSYEHAEALAWSGLQSTPAYPQNKRNSMNAINNKYLNRTFGHACP